MHILILNWRDPKNPKSGGAELVTLEHAKYWVKQGNTVTWYTSIYKNAKKQEIVDGVHIHRAGGTLSIFLRAPLFYLFSGRKFDLVVDEIHGIPFFTPLYVRKPKVAFIHEIAKEIWDYMFPFPINKIGKMIEPFYLSLYKNEIFWVPAKSTKDELLSLGVNENNIVMILCGITQKPLSKIYTGKEKNPTFIFVSRLVKMKGIEEILESFKEISQKLPTAKLWIVGGGELSYVKRLKRLTLQHKINKKVTFFGFVSESRKMELLKKAHLLLHASIKEGWGLVVIEAASMSTPSVVYDVAGLRDSVKNEETGVVLPKNNPTVMADEAITLLEDRKRYEMMQENCLKWARSLRWEKSTQESLTLLEKMVHGKKEK